jgi:photosystem II stability/assembly factor-like uncharacterized protein
MPGIAECISGFFMRGAIHIVLSKRLMSQNSVNKHMRRIILLSSAMHNTACSISLVIVMILLVVSVQTREVHADDASMMAKLADKSMLLDGFIIDGLMTVIGERGHVLISSDGKNWQQVIVPTRATLTGVYFYDKQNGWVVGHDAIILKTSDGAKTWKKVFSDIKEEAPLLDLFFKDSLNGIAIGAYSLMYTTTDGGSSWKKIELNLIDTNDISEELVTSEFTDVYDLHLNAIAYAGEQRFYIAAEAGHIFRSDDDGKTWLDLPSPYQGSFFGVLPLSFNNVLVYGLRGHLYLSSDAGNSWQQIDSATKEMLTDAKLLSNGDIIITGLAGILLLSKDNGRTFSNINLHHRNSLSAIEETEDGSILLTGDAGIQILPIEKVTLDN